MRDPNSSKPVEITKTNRFVCYYISLLLLSTGVCCNSSSTAQGNKSVQSKLLPSPTISASQIMKIIRKRQTSREFAARRPDRQVVSNLLWSAYGINRPDSGKRTAPSAYDWQYIDIYLMDSEALYKFNAVKHDLELVKQGDLRATNGGANAPLNLIYVLDKRKMMDRSLTEEDKALFAATTTGAIVQNVYLYCAATKLNTGVRVDFDRITLSKVMGLAPEQKIQLAQSVGYPPGLNRLKEGIQSFLRK